MARFLGFPKAQFFNTAGTPLSGGKVYVYAAGTTTPKDSYPTLLDAALSTNANANPVILDSRGEGTIVLKGNNKIVLKDSTDTTIWTVDNVNIQEVLSATDILDGASNELIKFSATASAVNEITIANAATGNPPSISSTGDNANIDLLLKPKGTGGIQLYDGNTNEILIMAAGTASAVNYIGVTNAATGNAPTISALGDDTNIDLHLQAKGSGTIGIKGTSTSPATVRFYEDTDNGTNYVALKAPASVTTSTTFTLPTADGTANQVLTTNGSGALSWSSPAAPPSAATQAEQEAASSTTVYASPGRQQFHPSSAKCWASGSTDGTFNASYNMTSITDVGTGTATFTIATDFSSANYGLALGILYSGGATLVYKVTAQAAGSFTMNVRDAATSALTDPTAFGCAAFGDQA